MIILSGVAGSGKSLQGRLLADEQGFAWISTGELLRVLVTGKQRHLMLQGELLSDAAMIEILDKVFDLIDLSNEFVLDGFPRTVGQAKWLIGQVKKDRLSVDAIFDLTAPQAIVRERLQGRGRLDDTDIAIDNRLEEYDTVTRKIMDLFKQEKMPVYEVDASQAPQLVHDSILRHVEALNITDDDQN
ncbi:MAG: adenylate kinase family protein [Candidatus Saccharimonadales bacterium]